MAADLPAEVLAAGAAWAPEHPSLRPMPASAMHVTLAFLGEVAAPDPLPARLAVTAGPARGLSLGAGRWLPPRRPRVLALEVADPGGALRALRARVAIALDHHEERAFLPHVTVARVRERVRPFPLPEPPARGFDAVALTLYRSHLGAGAARYEALWSVNLT